MWLSSAKQRPTKSVCVWVVQELLDSPLQCSLTYLKDKSGLEVEYEVLEANERVGGRLSTYSFPSLRSRRLVRLATTM